jgi:hypothetical protein
MNLMFFNIAVAIGWLMVLAGACMFSAPAGLIVGGALLLALTFAGARMAGVYAKRKGED